MSVSKILAGGAIALLLVGNGYAQNMYTCLKNGKKVMTDQPCADLGAQTHSVRGPESFQPPSGLGGLTDGEQRLAAEARQRDTERDQRISSQGRQTVTTTVTTTTTQQGSNNKAVCAQLEAEKQSVIVQQRARNNDWLTQRHREINDEMYRRRCETL